MPRRTPFQLQWHPESDTYIVRTNDGSTSAQRVPAGSAWIAWLDGISSFSFQSRSGGSCTIRKETGKRGGAYWYAYRRVQGHIAKRYLGRGEDLTPAALTAVADALNEGSQAGDEPSSHEIRSVTPDPLLADRRSEIGQASLPRLLLTTKLHVPRASSRLVSRPHIFHRLQRGLERPLTLISAPAGFGKTTSLCAWISQAGLRAAWVSLDADDNDATQFWTYVLTSLNQTYQGVAETALAMIQAPNPPPLTAIVRTTLNAIATLSTDVVLVLDDYHHITDETIHASLAQLLEHPPAQFHLYLAARHDPQLPLARLRAYDQVNLVRADDLRFRLDEVADFFVNVMSLDLPAEDVTHLAERSDGWVASLQIAGLSLQDHPHPSQFVASFGGSHRHILAYLGDEVFAAQPSEIQSFLIQTSILDHLCAPLCDAVTGRHDGKATLARLEQINLFLVALDDEGQWYRYYHPFADLLRHRLRQEHEGMIPDLHLRAARWLETQGWPLEAIEHYFAASDIEQAARVLRQIVPDMHMRGESRDILRLLGRLPEAILVTLPRLCLYQIKSFFFFGQLDMVEQRIADIERWVDTKGHTISSEEERKTILGEIALSKATLTMMYGKAAEAIAHAQAALEILPDSALASRASVLLPLGIAQMLAGDFQDADRTLADAIRANLAANNTATGLIALGLRSKVLEQVGRLQETAQLCRQIVQIAEAQGSVSQALAGSGYVGLGMVLYEWNDLVGARLAVEKGIDLGQQWTNLQDQMTGYAILALILQAQHQPNAAIEAYVQADRSLQALTQANLTIPWLPPFVAGVGARIALRQGRLGVAERWAQERELRADTYLPQSERHFQEFEYLTLARILMAQGRLDEMRQILDRALPQAEAEGRMSSVVEIHLLRALLFQAEGSHAHALEALQTSLSLAAPEGFVRVYLDEGAPLRALLIRLRERQPQGGVLRQYASSLLAAFDHPSATALSVTGDTLIEPLSEREREVLQLLSQGKSNQEIARHLIVAVSTVKTHIHHLFAKLQTTDRLQAVTRARELGLLG
jgi:LuxR family transcriptional regulator, maltose regulon positive regulatory protein